MIRRITSYVVFVTLMWSARAADEEIRQDKFKSNMTRNDFSHLLSSLIKLNEQRVNVLQKLYRLEDYGVLSEMLRSGDAKTGNGNSNNLFLIVMSKSPTDSSLRKTISHVLDPGFEVARSYNIPKQDYVLDPASFISEINHKENTLPESIFTNPKKILQKINLTTTKKLQHPLAKKRKHSVYILTTPKTVLTSNLKRRIEILDNYKNPYVSRSLYSSKKAFNHQSTRYIEIELTTKNDERTTKKSTIKTKLASKRIKAKNPSKDNVEQDEDDNDSPFSNENMSYHPKRETDENISKQNDNFVKKFFEINHLKPGKDQVISKEKDNSVKKIHKKKHHRPTTDIDISKINRNPVKKNDYLNNTKPGKDKVDLKVHDNSIKTINKREHPKPAKDKVISNVNENNVKKIDNNNYTYPNTEKNIPKINDNSVKKKGDYVKPETNQYSLKANVQRDQHTKLTPKRSNLLRFSYKKMRIATDRTPAVIKNNQIINVTVRSDTIFNKSSTKNSNLKIDKVYYTNAFMDNIRNKKDTDDWNGDPLITMDSGTATNILAPVKFPKRTKATPNRNILNLIKNHINTKYNFSIDIDKTETAKDFHNDVISKKVKHYDADENNNDGKNSNEIITLLVADDGKVRPQKIKLTRGLQLNQNGFDQTETKPVARQGFQKCLNKKATKLCYKSCKSAYRNVCRRMKCTSRSKRALKKECKRSCQKTFKSSKYSNEYSDESGSESNIYKSDESYED